MLLLHLATGHHAATIRIKNCPHTVGSTYGAFTLVFTLVTLAWSLLAVSWGFWQAHRIGRLPGWGPKAPCCLGSVPGCCPGITQCSCRLYAISQLHPVSTFVTQAHAHTYRHSHIHRYSQQIAFLNCKVSSLVCFCCRCLIINI